MPATNATLNQWLRIFIPGLLWIPYLIYVYHFSSPYPIGDDFDMFLGSLINLENARGFGNKITVLFSQHMEHRPALPRLIGFFVWKITGECNFRLLILLGNLLLMSSWIMLTRSGKNLTLLQAILLNATMIFILCGFQSKENIFWATGSLQNYGVIAFAIFSIYCCQLQKYLGAIVFSMLAIACGMAGFLVVPVLLMILLKNKKWVWLVVSIVLFGLIAFLYFQHFKSPDLSALPGVVLYKSPIVKIKYFFTFIGSFASIKMMAPNHAMIAGVTIFILTLFLHRNYKKWDVWTFISVFILLNALAGVYSRSELGSLQALSERYKIFSELLLITNLIKMFQLTFRYKTVAGSVILFLSTWMFILQFRYFDSFVKYNKENLKFGMAFFYFQKNPALLKYPVQMGAAERLIKSGEMGIYTIRIEE